jgi:glycosyltransferase involved in cell wall biosynthesis
MKKLLVISSAPLIKIEQTYSAYSPYEKEMQIWARHAKSIAFCCPIWKDSRGLLNAPISFKIDTIIPLKEFDIKSISSLIKSIYFSISNCFIIFKAIKNADHIHLRSPGNIGLLASIVQIFYPKKIKTAKYAGNWDSKSKQPWSYRLQKWILSNNFLTKNMQVLVYGKWENQSKNIKPFFTATYSEKEIQNSEVRIQKLEKNNEIKFLFVGTLSPGKQPLYVLELIIELVKKGYNATVNFYGEGNQRAALEEYIHANNLENRVVLKGNQTKEEVEKAYKNSHFLVLPSKSEGWPKVVAEAMFWNCLPIATKISCVPYMLDYGHRGILLEEHLDKDVLQIQSILEDENKYQIMSQKAQVWSREYTLEFFEAEIKKLLL